MRFQAHLRNQSLDFSDFWYEIRLIAQTYLSLGPFEHMYMYIFFFIIILFLFPFVPVGRDSISQNRISNQNNGKGLGTIEMTKVVKSLSSLKNRSSFQGFPKLTRASCIL